MCALHAEGCHEADCLDFRTGLFGTPLAGDLGRIEIRGVVLGEDLSLRHVDGSEERTERWWKDEAEMESWRYWRCRTCGGGEGGEELGLRFGGVPRPEVA